MKYQSQHAIAAALLLSSASSLLAASKDVSITLTDTANSIRVTAPTNDVRAISVRLSEKLPECILYTPTAQIVFPIPSNAERRVYPPDTFAAGWTSKAHAATSKELATYRNVALNPYDVRGKATYYPHATSNSECRNEADFCARNAIDGFKSNTGHGAWPYQSWGPDQRTDLWWKIEFGRPVTIDKLVLYIRADFPHDKHWHTATIEFSNGSRETINLTRTAQPQEFRFNKKTVTWLRLTNLIQDQPLGWCGITEFEAWGRDAIIPKPQIP